MSKVSFDNTRKRPKSNLVFEKGADGRYISVNPIYLKFEVQSETGNPEKCKMIFEIRTSNFYEFENGDTEDDISLSNVLNKEVEFEKKIVIKNIRKLKSVSKSNGSVKKIKVLNVPDLDLIIAVTTKDDDGTIYPSTGGKGRYTWVPTEKII